MINFDQFQEINSDLILFGEEPSCKFVIEPTSNSEDKMYMEIEYFQEKSFQIQRLKFTAYRSLNLLDNCQYFFFQFHNGDLEI